jgi:hypothetical protein
VHTVKAGFEIANSLSTLELRSMLRGGVSWLRDANRGHPCRMWHSAAPTVCKGGEYTRARDFQVKAPVSEGFCHPRDPSWGRWYIEVHTIDELAR